MRVTKFDIHWISTSYPDVLHTVALSKKGKENKRKEKENEQMERGGSGKEPRDKSDQLTALLETGE